MCFINKMDRVGADFYRCVNMISDRLGAVPLVLQLPIGSEAEFTGVLDILNMKEVVWKEDTLGAEFEVVFFNVFVKIPGQYKNCVIFICNLIFAYNWNVYSRNKFSMF